MMRCKYWDCGWCYCKTGKSNDINGKCVKPKECQVLRDDVITLAVDMVHQQKNAGNQMTEQNIRYAFELYAKNEMPGRALNRYGDGYANPSVDGKWFAFKAGWIAAFKVILESENE